MESLVPVVGGSRDILVGVGGFGSAKMNGSRWRDAGLLLGRTTYHLDYDSQVFPWGNGPPPSLLDFATSSAELRKMWSDARSGADSGAAHLSSWIDRWVKQGRSVMVVGFSLGAYVAWEATKLLPGDRRRSLDVVLVCGALSDSSWEEAEHCSSVTNVWSSSDLVLRWLYPVVAKRGETPAAGLGPIRAPSSRNLDVTDLVGSDHLWAGRNIAKILRVALGVQWSSSPLSPGLSDAVSLDEAAVERLSSWLIVLPELWDELGKALSGRPADLGKLVAVDRWSTEGDRFLTLLNAASTVSRLLTRSRAQDSADRSTVQLEGFIRRWMSESLPTERGRDPSSVASGPSSRRGSSGP